MKTRVFSSTTNTLKGLSKTRILMNADKEAMPDFSCIVRSWACSVTVKFTEQRKAVELILGGLPPELNFCFIFTEFSG